MKKQRQYKRFNLFFYIVVGYIFASYGWWMYLLLDKNHSAYEARIETAKLTFYDNYEQGQDEQFFNTETYQKLERERFSQRMMIIGEGIVFIALLLIGAVQVRRTYRKELALARQQSNFLLSITHELKSPLAGIKLALQTLLKRAPLENNFQRLLHNSLEDTDRLEGLVENILLAAKIENHSYYFDRQPVSLTDLLRHLAERMNERYAGQQITFNAKLQQDIEYDVDKLAFSSAILNLLENAAKYTPEGGVVTIHLNQEFKALFLEVRDQGQGLPDNEKKQVFNKFYRVGNEETRNTKGTGLGLYIVKEVVERHNGTISVYDNEPQGAVFRIYLPMA